MNIPRLRFSKPRREDAPCHVAGKRVIRYADGLAYNGEGLPGYYLITRSLEAHFVARGKCDYDAEFVCKVCMDSEKAFDRAKDARSFGRFLWTPAAVQRSLVKLYAEVRKDWEKRCLQQKETSK